MNEKVRLVDLANAVRYLAIDMIEAASSGHPGAPLGMADIAAVLWKEVLRYNPDVPLSEDRDRVILSNGHACAMLYAVLYLAGYPIHKSDLKSFRQVGSKTPGHPERDAKAGIEVATGPLGQGVANAVGIALTRRLKSNLDQKDYWVYCFAGDGCLMEGVSYEACSLAGTLGLQNLILLYDANDISIDGQTTGWFREDIPGRFNSQGWHVISDIDGHDPDAIKDALMYAKNTSKVKPTIIIFKTKIGKYVPDWEGKAIAHGQPLGKDRAIATKQAMQMIGEPFEIKDDVLKAWRSHSTERLSSDVVGAKVRPVIDWEKLFKWAEAQGQDSATRASSYQVLNQLPDVFLGGCADLTGSVLTKYPDNAKVNTKDNIGNYIDYGVREFAMAAIANGIASDGYKIPFVGTFLIFSDYAKNAIRMSALMDLQVIYVLTHDSIGLGEDGPTHQPVEQLSMLRAIPNLKVWRPCDVEEVVVAWQSACQSVSSPTCMVLTRQKTKKQKPRLMSAIKKGGFEIKSHKNPDLIIIATGSEVGLAHNVADHLEKINISVKIVSMPCIEVFREQPKGYKEDLLPSHTPKIAIEAGASQPWFEWVGSDGLVIGLDHFGMSGPGTEVFDHCGFHVEGIVKKVVHKFDFVAYEGEKK
ncbi:MAG: transketolase [Gammaproteobacteria bacterium]|nr:transketolase [Gammaproteobacteria bacterium]